MATKIETIAIQRLDDFIQQTSGRVYSGRASDALVEKYEDAYNERKNLIREIRCRERILVLKKNLDTIGVEHDKKQAEKEAREAMETK